MKKSVLFKTVLLAGMAFLAGAAARANVALTFGSSNDITNFVASSGAVGFNATGGAAGDGSLSLGGNNKSAYLTSQTITMAGAGDSASMTVDMGPLTQSSPNQSGLNIVNIGFVSGTSGVMDTIAPRLGVRIQQGSNAATYDARLLLFTFESSQTVSGGSYVVLVPGNYYRLSFAATRQTGNNYLLESALIDLGGDGTGNTALSSVSHVFSIATLDGLTLYSGIEQSNVALNYSLNEVDSYSLTTIPEPGALGLVILSSATLLFIRRIQR